MQKRKGGLIVFKYKQTKIMDKDYRTHFLVTTVKTSSGYETRILKVIDSPVSDRFNVNFEAPIAETKSQNWLSSRIAHAHFVIQSEKLIDRI